MRSSRSASQGTNPQLPEQRRNTGRIRIRIEADRQITPRYRVRTRDRRKCRRYATRSMDNVIARQRDAI